jgi:chloramphenicol 3-O-phosphotransferase
MERGSPSSSGPEPPALLVALLAGSATGAVPPEVERQLAEIRPFAPRVEWFGINERRVDAIVDSGHEQFRVVYFTDDGRRISSVSLFRRPPRFEGVDGGCAVVVNGASGAGKSSVLAALAEASELPWVILDEPVLGVVRQPYLIWRDRAPVLHRGFLEAIAALARRGNVVALSAAGHPPGAIDDAFAGVRVVRVGLDCDEQTLLARERGREGRWGGIVAASLPVHDGWRYDVRFDAAQQSAATIAAAVLRLVDQHD